MMLPKICIFTLLLAMAYGGVDGKEYKWTQYKKTRMDILCEVSESERETFAGCYSKEVPNGVENASIRHAMEECNFKWRPRQLYSPKEILKRCDQLFKRKARQRAAFEKSLPGHEKDMYKAMAEPRQARQTPRSCVLEKAAIDSKELKRQFDLVNSKAKRCWNALMNKEE